jgi:hypothetical protein
MFVEGAEGEDAFGEHGGDFVWLRCGGYCVGPDVDGVACVEGCVGGLVGVVDEEDFFADRCVFEGDAAGEAGVLVGSHLQRFGGVYRGCDWGDLEGHLLSL